MVDVSAKPITARTATAEATVRMNPETLRLIRSRDLAKGDVLEVARLAGIMGSKRTADLIPLCHPLGLDRVELDFTLPDVADGDSQARIVITATAAVTARTGVEMEALTAVSVAALTIYDMAKAVDREMTIGPIRLLEKTGGRSGHFRRSDSEPPLA